MSDDFFRIPSNNSPAFSGIAGSPQDAQSPAGVTDTSGIDEDSFSVPQQDSLTGLMRTNQALKAENERLKEASKPKGINDKTIKQILDEFTAPRAPARDPALFGEANFPHFPKAMLNQIQTRAEALPGEVSVLKTEVDELKEKRTTLRGEVQGLETLLQAENVKETPSEDEIKRLETALTTKQAELSSVEQKFASKQKEYKAKEEFAGDLNHNILAALKSGDEKTLQEAGLLDPNQHLPAGTRLQGALNEFKKYGNGLGVFVDKGLAVTKKIEEIKSALKAFGIGEEVKNRYENFKPNTQGADAFKGPELSHLETYKPKTDEAKEDNAYTKYLKGRKDASDALKTKLDAVAGADKEKAETRFTKSKVTDYLKKV